MPLIISINTKNQGIFNIYVNTIGSSYPQSPKVSHFPQAKQLPKTPSIPLDKITTASVYLCIDSEPYLGKSRKLNNQGMKAQVK